MSVPLDRSGGVPGSVSLFVERRPAAQPPARGAIFALAGGPGEAATPLARFLLDVLRPALGNRELVVFDERGTGRSDPLACPVSIGRPGLPETAATAACAERLGARRGFYTSRDSADDIDAIRQSLGVDKIELYGISYGTYTALTYARRHPQHVESLILDSTVAPTGIDPFDRATYAAVPRMLRDVCSAGACSSITPDPVADLDRVVRLLTRQPRLGVAYDGRGGPQLVRMSADGLHDLILGADLDPFLAAELPSLVRSAANGDYAPIARALRDARTIGAEASDEGPPLDIAANLARFCEETTFPWSRTAPLSARRGELDAAIGAIPADVFAPWDAQTELSRGSAPTCLGWPDASAISPAASDPLPDVPALILAGQEDMRTPLENAREVASLLPRASVVTIPHAGHSVSDMDCAQAALAQFAAGGRIAQCTRNPLDIPPLPLAPLSVRQLRPAAGVGGLPGRTLTAVDGTLADALQGLVVHLLAELSSGDGLDLRIGGLRGGFVRFDFGRRRASVSFHRFSYVPGVRLSGSIGASLRHAAPSGRLIVTGKAAARGVLRLGRRGRVTGILGGRRVSVRLESAGAEQARAASSLTVPRALSVIAGACRGSVRSVDPGIGGICPAERSAQR